MALKLGIVRDDRFLEHMPGHNHPEHPSRLRAVHHMLDTEFADSYDVIRPEPVTLEVLELTHTSSYIEKVLKTADHKFTSLASDTPASAKTYLSAFLAVGGCLKGVEAMVSGQCDVCFAMVRPPGHHALADRAGGFCIFNNLGVTARYAINKFNFRRILIIDWDVHHGNGIQDLFYREKKVLYFSTHDMLLYPYTGNLEETGKGRGEGYTINVPIPRDLNDADILHLYLGILTPVFRRYVPDLILIVAGFDAHLEDPIGRMTVTASAFADLTRLLLHLRSMADDPPILFALEGGYSNRGLVDSVRSVLNILTSTAEPHGFPSGETILGAQLVAKAREIHAPYKVWI
ncbi:MAG: histone deacetylase [Desulfobacterales bacterium]|jgi:acetoin utilization deacetylase AcuC-like enzyme